MGMRTLVGKPVGEHRQLVQMLMAYATISQARHDVLDELVEAIVEELDANDVEVEFEGRSIGERIEFVIHVVGPDEAEALIKDVIDHDGELPSIEFDEDDEDIDD
jgi:hypothetical protein